MEINVHGYKLECCTKVLARQIYFNCARIYKGDVPLKKFRDRLLLHMWASYENVIVNAILLLENLLSNNISARFDCVVPSIFHKVMNNFTEIRQLFSLLLGFPGSASLGRLSLLPIQFAHIYGNLGWATKTIILRLLVATKTRFFHVHIPWKICRSLIFLGCTLEARRNYSCILGTFFSFS